MSKDEKTLEPSMGGESMGGGTNEARPNRDAYSKMWGEDNNDIDFEDKEARYGRAIEDRNELRERRKADSALGGLFDRHNWLATMYSELRDNPDIDVFEWLEGFCNENDITIQEVLDNPEARKRLNEKLANKQKDNAERAASHKKVSDNLQKSYEALTEVFPDKSEDEVNQLWLDFWKIVEQAEQGVVDKKTMKDFARSLTYEEDMKSAREEGGMQARNEKIQNNVRKPSQQMSQMPPTLNQGAGAPQEKKAPKKQSFAKSFFGDIE